MSDCNCDNNGGDTPLPTLADVSSPETNTFCAPQATPVVPPCPEAANTTTSSGSSAGAFLDAAPTESMTLIGRVGKVLAKFTGNGFLRVDKGIAYLVPSLPMKVSTLYHYMTKMVGSARAVVGDPRPYPFKVISDSAGNTHLVSGLANNNSVEVWDKDKKVFSHIPVASFPVEVIGCLPKLDEVELVGFGNATAEDNCNGTGRPMHALTGNGLISLYSEEEVSEGCSQTKAIASVSTFPDDDREYYIRWAKDGGIFYEPKAEIQDGADGADGVDGADGADGKSNYQIWLDQGNVGSEQDFLDSLKGDSGTNGTNGTNGADGADGQNLVGELVQTNLLVDQSNLLATTFNIGVNVNGQGQASLAAPTRSDVGWLQVGGTGVFTFTTTDVAADLVQVGVSCIAAIGDVGDIATVDMDIVMELYKGGTLVAASAVFFEKGTSKTQASFNLAYTDDAPLVATYSLLFRKVGLSTATFLVQNGTLSANAIKKREVVETAAFNVGP